MLLILPVGDEKEKKIGTISFIIDFTLKSKILLIK